MYQLIGDMIKEIEIELAQPWEPRMEITIPKLLEIISIQQEMIEGLAKSRDEINSKLRSLDVAYTKYDGGHQPAVISQPIVLQKDLDLIGKELPSEGSDVIPPKTKPITCNVNVVPPNGVEW